MNEKERILAEYFEKMNKLEAELDAAAEEEEKAEPKKKAEK